MDDLSRVSEAIDLSGDYDPAIEMVNDNFGPGFAQTLAERGAGRTIPMLARQIGKQAYEQRGDMLSMIEAYVEVGSAGHRVEAANEPGFDSREIELSRLEGDLPSLCGSADQFGRCRERFHSAACAHSAESTAALSTPEDAQAWRTVLHAVPPFRWLTALAGCSPIRLAGA
jgi:hypothetical protein